MRRESSVAERPIEQMTLREMFTDAERLTRDLIEHLDQGFSPRAHQLLRLVRPTETEAFSSNIEDVTVRGHSARLLESEDFAEEIYGKLARYCTTIDENVSRIVTGE
jgi:hypothetical protein